MMGTPRKGDKIKVPFKTNNAFNSMTISNDGFISEFVPEINVSVVAFENNVKI